MGVAFFVSVFRPTREAHMADSIAVDSPVDVGINEMFHQLSQVNLLVEIY